MTTSSSKPRSWPSRMQHVGQAFMQKSRLLASFSPSKQPGRSPRQPLLQAYRLRQVASASSACPASTQKETWLYSTSLKLFPARICQR